MPRKWRHRVASDWHPVVLGFCLTRRYEHASHSVFLLPILRLWVRVLFPAVHYCPGSQQAGHAGDFPAEPLPRLECDWMDRRAGLGGEKRCSRGGEVAPARDPAARTSGVGLVADYLAGCLFYPECGETARSS